MQRAADDLFDGRPGPDREAAGGPSRVERIETEPVVDGDDAPQNRPVDGRARRSELERGVSNRVGHCGGKPRAVDGDTEAERGVVERISEYPKVPDQEWKDDGAEQECTEDGGERSSPENRPPRTVQGQDKERRDEDPGGQSREREERERGENDDDIAPPSRSEAFRRNRAAEVNERQEPEGFQPTIFPARSLRDPDRDRHGEQGGQKLHPPAAAEVARDERRGEQRGHRGEPLQEASGAIAAGEELEMQPHHFGERRRIQQTGIRRGKGCEAPILNPMHHTAHVVPE
jgi:hypothetical protein